MPAKKTLFPDVPPSDRPLIYHESAEEAFLLLNRPEKCNALSLELLTEFCLRLDELEKRPDLRVLVIAGTGEHFCAGLDLFQASSGESVRVDRRAAGEFLTSRLPGGLLDSFPPGPGKETLAVPKSFWMPRLVAEILYRIGGLPQVVVGAARGAAYGGGGALLAACDIALAEPNLRMGFTESRLALAPTLLHPFLSRRVSPAALAPFLLTGEPIPAGRALHLGLVDEVFPEPDFPELLRTRVRNILSAEVERVRQTKLLLRPPRTPAPEEILRGLLLHYESWNSPAAVGRVAAFVEKRFPPS